MYLRLDHFFALSAIVAGASVPVFPRKYIKLRANYFERIFPMPSSHATASLASICNPSPLWSSPGIFPIY
jgi:hypothetical protein